MATRAARPADVTPRTQRQDDATPTHFLRQLGGRIREARSRRGVTRKILARDSGVSERYLAQLETGNGNISITLLRRVADALSLPLADLVREGPTRPVEFNLLVHTLSRLSAQELADARQLLGRSFGAAVESDRRRRIALIGLRGAGKSTLGRLLAESLGVPFIELDREVEREIGAPLREIFDLYGQATYHRAEKRSLEAVIEHNARAVIATGGSLVSEPATFELLLSACFTVWLKAEPEEHMSRVFAQGDIRPMAASEEATADLRRILAGRSARYAKADATIDTSRKLVETSLCELMTVVGGRST